MHGRKIIIGTPITDAGFILSNGITSMSRGTILYMTVGTYGLANNAMESPQIFSIIGIMQCIIFLLEMSLHCFSLLIGYANFTLHQLRLILIFVSQYFAVSSREFTQPFSVHDERHFAEEGDDSPLSIRYNGSESSESCVRYNGSIKKIDEVRHYGHAFLNYESNVQHTLLTDYVDMSTNPTFVILDSGCTRAMGSRFAIDRLVKACMNHRYSHLIKFTKEASNNRFSFANGESSHVKEKLIIHLKNPKHPTGWVTTTVDILDKGRVPILFSVEQMRNLRMNIEHTPAGEFLTCPVFGLKRYALSVATSNHPILDVMFLARCGQKPEHSFAATNKITCPSMQWKNTVHTRMMITVILSDQKKVQSEEQENQHEG